MSIPRSGPVRATRRGVLWTAFALTTLGACARGEQPAVSAGAQDSLPLPSVRLIQLAAEAEARLDSASRVRSGARPCGTAGAVPSAACELELTVRFDTDSIPMNAIPGGFAVLAVVRNVGDSTEARTGIPGGTTAYFLVRQGGPRRADAWYFSIDQATQQARPIRRLAYVACPVPHADTANARAAFRFCPPGGADAPALALTDSSGPPPTWMRCPQGCCLGE